MRLDRIITLEMSLPAMEDIIEERPAEPAFLLLENGGRLLLENGGRLLLESSAAAQRVVVGRRPVPPNDFGEAAFSTLTLRVWAKRQILTGAIFKEADSRVPLAAGTIAAWTVRYREDLAIQTTGLTDDRGQKWRVTSTREIDPDRVGRDRYLELTAESQESFGEPRAPRS